MEVTTYISMMKVWKKRLWLIALISVIGIDAFAQSALVNQEANQLLADNVFHLSEVMLHDAASPPAASRPVANRRQRDHPG
mgnify:CR=1 FL=1